MLGYGHRRLMVFSALKLKCSARLSTGVPSLPCVEPYPAPPTSVGKGVFSGCETLAMESCPFPWGLFPANPPLCCRAGPFPCGTAGSYCLSLCDFRGTQPYHFLQYMDTAARRLSISSRLSRLSRVCLCQTFSPALKPLLHLLPKSLSYSSVISLQQTQGLRAASWLRFPGAVSRGFRSSYSAHHAVLSCILHETQLPRSQPFGVLGLVPCFHREISISQCGQSSGWGLWCWSHLPLSAHFPANLRDFVFTPNLPPRLMTQLPLSYPLPFISGPCLVLQRRVEQCDTDGEIKAGGEEVNLPRSASRGDAGSSADPAVAAWELWALETRFADQPGSCQHLSCAVKGCDPRCW